MYFVFFGDDNKIVVRLRGKMFDFGVVMFDVWLRSKINVEGYLEVMVKLIVWVVVVLLGNMI